MHTLRIMVLTGFVGFAGLAGSAGAGLLPVTIPVIAILAGELYLGEAEGYPDGSGTIKIQSRIKPDVTCRGRFTHSAQVGGTGNMRCSDGTTAVFQFQRLSFTRGHGTGSSSRGAMSFTYGLNANESGPYLTLPPYIMFAPGGRDLVPMETRQPFPANLALAGPATLAPEFAPDVQLSAAVLVVTAMLKQDRDLQATGLAKIADPVELAMQSLFDFRHMTQIAVARHWRLATPAQQNTLTAEFRTLVVHAYSAVLENYRDQVIEYKPLRTAPGETDVTVRSTIGRTGSDRVTIDYDMEKTATGWMVYNIKVDGVSLITTYQSTFTKKVQDDGIEGLIQSLAAKNRRAIAGLSYHESGARPYLIVYALKLSVLRGGR